MRNAATEAFGNEPGASGSLKSASRIADLGFGWALMELRRRRLLRMMKLHGCCMGLMPCSICLTRVQVRAPQHQHPLPVQVLTYHLPF